MKVLFVGFFVFILFTIPVFGQEIGEEPTEFVGQNNGPITDKKSDNIFENQWVITIGSGLILAVIIGVTSWFWKSKRKTPINSRHPQSLKDESIPTKKSYDIEIPAGASKHLDNPYVNHREYVGKLEHPVIWQNNDGEDHSITSGRKRIISEDNDVEEGIPDGLFHKIIKPHENFEFKFPKEGTYHYFCEIHKCSEATIVIE